MKKSRRNVLVIALFICAVGVAALIFRQYQRRDCRQEIRPDQERQTEVSDQTEVLTDSTEEKEDVSGQTEDGEAMPDLNGQSEQTETDGVISEQSEQTEDETSRAEEPEKLVVAIDPGHQGSWVDMSDTEPVGPGSSEMKAKSSTGTQGAYSGVPEYELNLDVSLKLRSELESRGYEVVLTREDNDTAISNSERALKAYEEGGDIYVRIHANGSDDASIGGALAMVPSETNPYVGELAADSYLLADCILNAYCENTPFTSLGIQYYDNMTGMNWSRIPVMILEMGFMTNESDDLQMQDVAVQEQMAEGIADGIDRYFQQKGMAVPDVSGAETGTRQGQTADNPAGTKQSQTADGLTETAGQGRTAGDQAQAKQMDDLVQAVKQELAPALEAGEQWAVSVKDIYSGEEADINGDLQMKSASVIKVFIMAAVYDRVCYPSSEDRYIYFYESYDGELRELISQMITVSDNDAANTILERLGDGDAQAGMAVVNQFCRENGYGGTSLGRMFLEENPSGDNYTSAKDCMNLLESIYSGMCVNEEASQKMYEFLKGQTRTEKIPAGLPEGAAPATANKTGELFGEYGDYVENDIAVVDNGAAPYILCIMSQDLTDDEAAVTRIRSISGVVYERLC